MTLKLGIDVDGVLAMWDQPFADLLAFLTNSWPRTVVDPTTWDWPAQLGYSRTAENAAWDYIRAHPKWWMTLSPYPDSELDLQALEAEWDLYFITARRTPHAKVMTAEWLRTHYAIESPSVLLTADKGRAAKALDLDVFIDDKVSHCVDIKLARPATRVYLRMRAHNLAAQPHVERDGILLTTCLQSMVSLERNRLRHDLEIPR